MTVGEASFRQSFYSFIKWLISDSLGWGHKLGTVTDS